MSSELNPFPSISSSTSHSQSRSIPGIISSLRAAFRDADFNDAARDLMSREAKLRAEKQAIEVDFKELKHRELELMEECSRLKRECEVNHDKLKESARDLAVSKENEEKAMKRCQKLVKMVEDVRVLEREKEELRQKLNEEQLSFTKKIGCLKDEVEDLKGALREKEREINELVAENNRLEMEMRDSKVELDVRFEELKMLERKVEDLVEEEAKLKKSDRVKDDNMNELRKRNQCLEMEKREVMREKDEQKAKLDANLEGLRKENEERMEKVMKRNQLLEEENAEIVRENHDKVKELARLEKQVSKLEEHAVMWMCLNVAKDKKFAGTDIGRTLSEIIKALDSEETGLSCSVGKKDGNIKGADSVIFSGTKEEKLCKNSGMESEEAVRIKLASEAEVSGEDGGATCIKKVASSGVIHINDSDGDTETPLHGSQHKRRRESSERENDGSSSDDTLNPINQTKKLKDESTVAAMSGSRSGLKFVTPDSQTKVVIRKCSEKLEEVKGTSYGGCLEDDDSQDNDTSTLAENFSIADIEEFISTCRKKPKLQKI